MCSIVERIEVVSCSVWSTENALCSRGETTSAGMRVPGPHWSCGPEEPTWPGYSIGKWLDTDGDGKWDTLEVETTNLKGPRVFEASGIPLHEDNQTVVKERMYLDKTDKAMLRNEVTTNDNALTRPWTVMKTYRRDLLCVDRD